MAVILIFETIHHALAAEKNAVLVAGSSAEFAAGPIPELIPLPASVKSDCGFGLLVEGAEALDDDRMKLLIKGGMVYSAAYRRIGKERKYERIG
jgi:hypothetical protein